MSATDSDNSIDWLASDNEENESEPASHCSVGPPDSSCSSSRAEEGGDAEVSEVSSWGSPSCVDKRDRDTATGLRRKQHGKDIGRTAPALMKRPPSPTEEQSRDRHLYCADKDQVFHKKCVELQRYIHPLSSILQGLRSGRYKERLSTFQESVAMDRIQRIMGVLQNPFMGEKYVDIILKMEAMLKSWFPHVKLQNQLSVSQTEDVVPSKRLKLSSVTCSASRSPASFNEPLAGVKPLSVTDLTPPEAYSANNLKWLHTSPICSLMVEQASPRLPPSSPREPTQDSAVSSSTDADTQPVRTGPPPPGKINAPCLERLLKSTDSIITRGTSSGLLDSSWS